MYATQHDTFDGAPCLSNPEPFLSVIEFSGARKVAECAAICAPCPVKAECLALGTYESYTLPGVYGGKGQAEREAAAWF
jgi:hypothetical protein